MPKVGNEPPLLNEEPPTNAVSSNAANAQKPEFPILFWCKKRTRPTLVINS
jgi:hypothetical protein